MSDAVIARIRTTVPALVGAALAWLATHYAIDVPAGDAQAITVGLTTILTLAWYSGVQLFARRWPSLGWLLGHPGQPTYGTPLPADVGQTEPDGQVRTFAAPLPRRIPGQQWSDPDPDDLDGCDA